MAKICNSCKLSYADNLAACPHCASSVEIILGDPVKPASGTKKGNPLPRRPTDSDSDIDIDLGKLPQSVPGAPDSAISDVKWSALISRSSDSGVDLAAQDVTVDSPSDMAILGGKNPKGDRPGGGGTSGSWVDIAIHEPGREGSGIVVEGGGVAQAPAQGPGSGSDDDIDLARLEAESRGQIPGLPPDGSGVVLEGSPIPGSRPPLVEVGSGSDIDISALAAPGSTASPFPEHLLPVDGSEIDLGQSKRTAEDGPSGLDLIAEALESGVDLAGNKAPAATGDSGVDLAALFEDEVAPARIGKKPRATDASAVDLGAQLSSRPEEPVAREGKVPHPSSQPLSTREAGASDVSLAGSDVVLAGSSGPRNRSDVSLAGSDVTLAGSSSKQPRSSDVQLAGGSKRRNSGSDVELAGSDVALVGSSKQTRGSDVQLAGSDVELADSGVNLGDLALADVQDSAPKRTTVPATQKRGVGAWTGGILGGAATALACAGIYFSGLLPGSSSSAPPQTAGPNEAAVKKLQSEVARLQGLETEAKENAELAMRLDAELKEALAKADGADKGVLAKAEAARKQAEQAAEKALADAEAARKQAVSLTAKLNEAEKIADPKTLAILKQEREDALQKAALADKDRKAADAKVASLEKDRKAAEEKAVELATAAKAAQAKADEAAQMVAQLRKQENALNAKLEEARKAANPKAMELLTKDREAAAAKIAELEKDRKAAQDKLADLTLALKEARNVKPADPAIQKQLDAARAEAAAAGKRFDEAAKALQTVERAAEAARVEAVKAKGETAQALVLVKELKDLLAKSAAGQRVELPATADPLEAELQYTAGVQAFYSGNYVEAERALADAARQGIQDARYLYFLGLARYQQGNTAAADVDFREAARLERQSKPGRAGVNRALERIQGPGRQALERYR